MKFLKLPLPLVFWIVVSLLGHASSISGSIVLAPRTVDLNNQAAFGYYGINDDKNPPALVGVCGRCKGAA